ncbi:hypothetical protein IW261DRAFT_783220 [Armillaria novae-zelandiae]|uniref:Uncharacterized protein n=1 Tax=Armillaria novae-zelandiae TaxID=153914 RepID=A0AA39PKV6_9AGAR|nr:hypothetical protein IW261DRAFT_783220 [Armillaria novae-zelandiae]
MQNPYNVWGTLPSGSSSEIPPSIYGALPWNDSSSSNAPRLHTFYFAALNPSIANCVVLGPNNDPQFYVTADSNLPGYTVLKTANGQKFGLIEWKSGGSQVEIRGAVPKQATSTFLSLSPDRRYRIMHVGDSDYIWMPDQNGIRVCVSYIVHNIADSDLPQMCLGGDMSSTTLAKVTRESSSFKLEMRSEAVQAGLIHSAIAAIVLLESGSSI